MVKSTGSSWSIEVAASPFVVLQPIEDADDPPGVFSKHPPPLNGLHQVADDPKPEDGPSSSDDPEPDPPSNGQFPKLPPPLNGRHQVADDPEPEDDGPASSSLDDPEPDPPSNGCDDDDPEPMA